jgi:hypothetical protein
MEKKQDPSLRGYTLRVLGIAAPTGVLALVAFGPAAVLGTLLA